MQESFEVTASSGSYRVLAGPGLLKSVVAKYPDAIFMVDARLEFCLPEFIKRRIVVGATEGNKSLERMPEVILQLRQYGANRTTHLVAIGGGVIQDVATFVASIYMRGIAWTYMPTTLLGMADSCIGGKSSVNVLGYKNLVGNFYPPVEVMIDIDFVRTLNAEMVVGGLYEAAKICFARGEQEFLAYLGEYPSANMLPDRAQRVVMRALLTKKWFIETDEFDQKERLLLNFGHTFGHAIEAGTNFAISHGIAVGVGMLVAITYARKRAEVSSAGLERAKLLSTHVKSLLGTGADSVVPVPPQIDIDLVMEKFSNDKKHRTDVYRMVVPQGDGDLALISEPKNEAVRRNIISAYEEALCEIGWSIGVGRGHS